MTDSIYPPTRQYQIVDAKNELVGEPFDSEREAYKAKKMYQENCSDITLPLRIVPVEEMR